MGFGDLPKEFPPTETIQGLNSNRCPVGPGMVIHPVVRVYCIYPLDFRVKGGMTIFNIRSLDSGTYVRRFLVFFATTKPSPYEVVTPQKSSVFLQNQTISENEMRMKQGTLRSFFIV